MSETDRHVRASATTASGPLRWGPVVLFALVIAVGFAYFRFRAAGPRQSVTRAEIMVTLRRIAQATEAYQRDHGVRPTINDLLASGYVLGRALVPFSEAEYASTAAPAGRRVWLVQTRPSRAVKQGEPWGDPGQSAERDFPPVRGVLFDDLAVAQLEESDYQASLAGQFRLVRPGSLDPLGSQESP